MLFMSILKSSDMDPNMRKELLDLHSRQSELGAKIKLQKYMEYKYNQLKIEELNERIDEMKFQSKFFIKRNKNILEEINKNDNSSFELASSSNQILENLIKCKKNYQNYLNSLLPKLLNQFNAQIFQNNLLSRELNNIKENEKKNNFYNQLIDYNDNKLKEIDNLKKKNELLILQNSEKEKILLEKEKVIESDITKEEILKSQNDGSYLNLMPNKPLLKQYVLNMNHNSGILDNLKKEKIDNINKKLRMEYNQKNNNPKDLLNDSQNSLDDLRNQILPIPKFYTPNVMEGTLNQNFDNNNNDNKDEKRRIIIESNFNILNSNIKYQSIREEVKKDPKIEEEIRKPKIEEEIRKPKIEEVKKEPRIKEEDDNGSNHEYDDFDVEVIDDKNIKLKKGEGIEESKKEEINNNASSLKIDEEEKKKEMKEEINREEKKELEVKENDDNGSNHEYDDFDIEVIDDQNKKIKKGEEIKESKKEEINNNGSSFKIDEEEKKKK